jgi:glucose/arabinose dehydrogenase
VGGTVQVGRDGKPYVSHGENARAEQAQSLRNLLGKIVRLNRDGTIPADNPFFARANGRNRAIWARGLRNPFKFAFDPGSSLAYVNDVGQSTWEEIDRLARGANYGWPVHEGPESAARFVPPLFAYRHGATGTTGCSITGGEFYRSARRNFPARFVGDYFFADLCNGWVRRYDPGSDRVTPFADGLGSPVDLEVGSGGALYVLVFGQPGSVQRIRFTG